VVGVDHPSPEDAQQDDEDGELVANVSKLFSLSLIMWVALAIV
jgi:hypothetical protein